MERYANKGGDSGVVAFDTTHDSITVEFRDNSVYLYNNVKPGSRTVDHMQTLARSGQGLNSYISTTVKKNYARKIR